MNSTIPIIYCAIDTNDLNRALDLSKQIAKAGCGIKLGLEFFSAHGVLGVKAIKDACPNISIFLDLKFHDIPNTVAGAIRSVANLGIDYINVHALGGLEMMQLAQKTLVDECRKVDCTPPKLLAVTVLTSMDDRELERTGQDTNAKKQVLRLAKLVQMSGLSGVVCSAEEIEVLRNEFGKEFILMVPGIRPNGAKLGDQKRVTTPEQAITSGATHLVIGRPITESTNPFKTACDILQTVTNN